MHLFSRTALYSLCTMLNCLGSAHLHVLHMIAYQSRARSASATRDVSETWRLDRKLAKTLCNCGGGLVVRTVFPSSTYKQNRVPLG
jgi:hypothetical protein